MQSVSEVRLHKQTTRLPAACMRSKVEIYLLPRTRPSISGRITAIISERKAKRARFNNVFILIAASTMTAQRAEITL